MGRLAKAIAIGFTGLTVGGSALAVAKRQDISDWAYLRSYQPSDTVLALAERTTMSQLGKKLFYVHDPQLLDKSGFNLTCSISEKTIVLGCYTGDGIYLYDIADPRLEGVEEVTAAHEMLHAAYDRLSTKEKSRVNSLLDQALKQTTEARILELIQSYKNRDQSTIYTEMHSIFATELKDIPGELEAYYSRYFLNRQTVVGYSEKYEEVFLELEARVEAMDADLLLRKSQIESNERDLENKAAELTTWAVRLEQYKSSNNITAYNSEVDDYNNAVYAYNAELGETKELIAEYNVLVEERNQLALQQNELIKSLDSKAKDL